MRLVRANQEILYEWTIRHRVTEHSPFHAWGLGTERAARRDNYVISVVVSVLDAASNTRVTLLHNFLCDQVKIRHRLAGMWREQTPKKAYRDMTCCEAFKYKLSHHAYRVLCMWRGVRVVLWWVRVWAGCSKTHRGKGAVVF